MVTLNLEYEGQEILLEQFYPCLSHQSGLEGFYKDQLIHLHQMTTVTVEPISGTFRVFEGSQVTSLSTICHSFIWPVLNFNKKNVTGLSCSD